MPIKAVVFDLDDTLYLEADYALSGFRQVDQWVYRKYGAASFYEKAAARFAAGDRLNVFNQILDEMNLPYGPEDIEEMVALYRSHDPDITLLPDAAWALDRLKGRVKLALISDGYLISQSKKCNALRLFGRFHSVVLTDEMGKDCWKPSPLPYAKTCKNLRISHRECMYVGDNVAKDFVAANRLGWTTVQVCRKSGVYSELAAEPGYGADYRISDLKELLSLPPLAHLFPDDLCEKCDKAVVR